MILYQLMHLQKLKYLLLKKLISEDFYKAIFAIIIIITITFLCNNEVVGTCKKANDVTNIVTCEPQKEYILSIQSNKDNI